MRTTQGKIEFAGLPKGYAGLCQILTPRPIHDKVEFRNVLEITDAMAGHNLTPDQEDYLLNHARTLARHFGVSADLFLS
jgi:HTH-type transcriptional regulator/antitoxin HigA